MLKISTAARLLAQRAVHLLLRLVADGAGVVHDHVRVADVARACVPRRLQGTCSVGAHALRVSAASRCMNERKLDVFQPLEG